MEQFVQLSWRLLEYKLMYYNPDRVHSSWNEALTIPDSDYDQLESQYKTLGNSLGLPLSVTEMVDFDFSRPSCKLVMKKLASQKENKND